MCPCSFFYGSSGNSWVKGNSISKINKDDRTAAGARTFYFEKPTGNWDHVIFTRNKTDKGEWGNNNSNIHNQTADIELKTNNFCYFTDGGSHVDWNNNVWKLTKSVNPSGKGTITVKNGTDDVTSVDFFWGGNSLTYTNSPLTGYIFKNWTYNGTSESSSTLTKSINSNTTIVANFEVKPSDTYKVKLNRNGGSGSDYTITTEVGKSTTLQSASSYGIGTPSGKKDFDRWNTEADGTGTDYSTVPSQAKDSTFNLYAQWKDYNPSNGYWIEFFNSPTPRSPQRVKLTHNGKTDSTSEWTATVELRTGDSFKIVRYESEIIPAGQYWGTQYIDEGTDSASAADQISKKTVGYDNNIDVSVPGNYNFTFHDYYEYNKLWVNSITYQVTYHANGGTGSNYVIHPKVGKNFITEDIEKAKFTPPTGQTFDKWNTNTDGSGTSYGVGASVNGLAQDGNLDLYAIWKGAQATFKYRPVINGTYMDWWDQVSKTINYGTHFYDIEPNSVYGFEFDGWYSDQTCKNGIGNDEVQNHTSQQVYAKFSSTTKSKQIYAFIPSNATNAYNDLTYGGVMSIWMQKDEDNRTKDVHVQKVGDFTSGHLYTIALPNDATGFSFHKGLANGEMQNGLRSVWINPADIGENNMYVFNNSKITEDKQQRYNGEWKSCYFQFQMSATDGSWTDATKVGMNKPTSMSSGNDAELTNVSVDTNKSFFRVAIVIDGNEIGVTTTGTDPNTLAVVTASGSHQFNNSISVVNVYLKSNTIYLVDAANIQKGGYLYISTTRTPADFKISVSFTNTESKPESSFSNAKLTSVDGVSSTDTLKFNIVIGMIRIPIYNLRGQGTPASTSSYSVTLIIDGTSQSFTLPNTTTAPNYYMEVGNDPSSGALDAKAAYNIDATIKSLKNQSVCECSQQTAKKLVQEYNSGTTTSLRGAEIKTYSGSLGSELAFVNIQLIECQLENIANFGENAFKSNLNRYRYTLDNENNTVLIIIISSISLLTLAGASLLIIKKRKH